jgi:hypothetical protein
LKEFIIISMAGLLRHCFSKAYCQAQRYPDQCLESQI